MNARIRHSSNPFRGRRVGALAFLATVALFGSVPAGAEATITMSKVGSTINVVSDQGTSDVYSLETWYDGANGQDCPGGGTDDYRCLALFTNDQIVTVPPCKTILGGIPATWWCPLHEPDLTAVNVDLGDGNDVLREYWHLPKGIVVTDDLGPGDDELFYHGGNGARWPIESIFGGPGDDRIRPRQAQVAHGAEAIYGGPGADLILGANNDFYGDNLLGGSGPDILKTKGGADRLNGGGDRDVCNGGTNQNIGAVVRERDKAGGCERQRNIP